MTQWEYKVVQIADANAVKYGQFVFSKTKMEVCLNELGVEGWELIAVPDESLYYFKRKLS